MERKDFVVGKKYQYCSNPESVYTCVYAGRQITILVNDATRVEYSVHRLELWAECKERIVRYVNFNIIRGSDIQITHGGSYPTRKQADACAHNNAIQRVACVRIEFEEGQYDE